MLKIVAPTDIESLRQDPVDPVAREQATSILKEVTEGGKKGLLDVAVRLRDLESTESKES